MRKFYLSLLAIFALALNANAGIKVIYNETFETAADATAAGWASPSLPAGLSIASDDYGKFLSFAPGNVNDRSAHTLWGADLIKNANVSKYTVSFDFSCNAFGNNHTTTEITLMSNETTCTKKANGNFRGNTSDWLFDLTQLATTGAAATGDQPFAINGDSTMTINISAGTFYTVTLDIDTLARTVDYSIVTVAGASVATGTYEVANSVPMAATGIYYVAGRYNNVAYFDNIKIQAEVDADVANDPTITLVGINNKQRVYQISFIEGETLHVNWNGTETTVMYSDCDGVYTWSNNPDYNPDNEDLVTAECASGTLEAYTTAESATSNTVSATVDNSIIYLPTAVATISAVESGYGKTYTITADNSTVELAPTLFVDAVFTAADGTTQTWDDLKSGNTVELASKGTLTLTTKAFGYGETTTTVENDVEYAQATEYNFAHYTESEILAMGFSEDGKVTGNYSTYGRLYGWDASTYVEGGENNAKIVYSDIPQYTKVSSLWADSVIVGDLAFTAVPSVNVHIYKGVGLVLEGKKGDDGSGNWISSLYLTVNGLTANDFIMTSSMGNYGSSSLHPVVADLDAYLASYNAPVTSVVAGTETVSLYRISDCISRIQVFKPTNSAGIESIAAKDEAKASADAPVYSINGMRVNKANLQKGVYIQNGKKFVVK